MANIDDKYLKSLVDRLSGYKSPTDTQRLIMQLADNRSDATDRQLSVLLRAEKQADKLAEARADARRILDTEKKKARRIDTRKKIVLGGALRQGAKHDKHMRQALTHLWDSGYISDDDKTLLQADYDAITSTPIDGLSVPPEPQ